MIMEVVEGGGGGGGGVGNVGEGIIFSDACKLTFTTTTAAAAAAAADIGPSDMFTLNHDSEIKTEANLVAQALSQMVTLTPDQSGLSASGLPLGTVLSMAAAPNSPARDQVFITVQHVGGNGTGNFMDLIDDGKPDLSQTLNQMTSPTLVNLNGTTQLVNGNFQTFVNLQGPQGTLNGFDGIPQMATMGIPTGPPGLMGSFNPNGVMTLRPTTVATNGTMPQAMEMGFHSMPQTVNVPQFVFANGQLMQSVPGMNQVFVPAAQAAMAPPPPPLPPPPPPATQQVLSIPINQLPSNLISGGGGGAGAQLVQLLTPNGQVITTSLAGLQTLTGQPPPPLMNAAVQPQPVQSLSLPQIMTNCSGQILAVSPQLIGHQPGLVQIYGSPGQLQIEKLPPPLPPQQQQQQQLPHQQQQQLQMQMQQSQNLLPNDSFLAVNKPLQTTVTSGPPPSMAPPQTAHIQIPTVADTTQTNAVTQRTVTTPTTQVVQVAQTSSPSITSTESSTPISQTSANTVDGINLEEIKEFAKAFKLRRLSLGLTQTQVGQALSITEGPAYSQSAICRFEKLDITPKSAQRIKPVLEHWMRDAEERYRSGVQDLTGFVGTETSKKRKRRTSFTPQALEVLAHHFDRNSHPTGAEMTELACKLNYEREVVRVWFCNKRQTLKNTVNKKLKTIIQ